MKITQIIQVCILLIFTTKSIIVPSKNLSLFSTVLSIDVHEKNFGTFDSYYYEVQFYTTTANYAYFQTTNDFYSYQVRTFQNDTNSMAGTFSQFISSYLIVSIPSVTFGIYPSTTSSTFINMCFFNTSPIYFALSLQTFPSSYYYIQLYYKWNILSSQNIAISSLSSHDKMIYYQNYLYISFQTGIQIYQIINSVALIKSTTILYNKTVLNYIDMSIDHNFICYSTNYTINLLYHMNYSIYWSINLTQNIIGVKLINNTYILATTYSKIYQIDYQQKNITSIVNMLMTGNLSIGYFQPSKQIILYYQYPNTNSFLPLYNINQSYKSTNNSCFPTYIYISKTLMCIKNLSLTLYINYTNNNNISTVNYTNSINISNLINISNNIVNNSAFSRSNNNNVINNSNSNNIVNNSIQNIPQQPNFINSIIDKLNSSTVMKNAINFLGKSMSFASMRITPTFLLSFTGFLDDLWYYKYHRTQYPKSAQYFMQQVNIMNQLRLSPWFLEFLQFINDQSVCIQQNQNMYEYLKFDGNDPTQVYFLYSAQDTYKSSLIMNVLFLSILKLLYLILFKIWKIYQKSQNQILYINQSKFNLKDFAKQNGQKNQQIKSPNEIKRNPFKKYVINSLNYNSRFWLIFNAMLQINMLKLTFNCFNQFLFPSHFSFMDKINMFVASIFALMLLLYCFCYYPLIYSFNSKPGSQILLTRTCFSLNSFFFESIYIVFRNFSRSIIHAFFISNYQLQISLLAGIDIFYFAASIKMWRFFINKFIGFFCVLYSFSFLCFDLFFSIKIISNKTTLQNIKQQYATIVIFILACTSLTISLVFLGTMLSYFLKPFIINIINKCLNKNMQNIDESKKILKSKNQILHPIIKVFIKRNKKISKKIKLTNIRNNIIYLVHQK